MRNNQKRGPILFWWRLLSISRVARNHSWWIGPSDGGIFLFFREGQCKNDVVRLFLKGRKTTTAAQKKAKHFVGFCGVAALGCGDPCIIIAIRQEPPGKLNTGITWRNRLERRDCGQCCCWSMGIFCLFDFPHDRNGWETPGNEISRRVRVVHVFLFFRCWEIDDDDGVWSAFRSPAFQS